jgi:hypothetical protein
MIQNVEFVSDWNTGALQVVDRLDDVDVLHVPAGVVVGTDGQYSGVLSQGRADDPVQDVEVLMIPGQQNELILDAVLKVPGIAGARQTS